MKNINLIDLNYLNKKKLLLAYHKNINLSNDEVLFLIKMITFFDENQVLKLSLISKEFSISKKVVDEIIANLISKKIIKFKKLKSKNEFIINYSLLWDKILDFISFPSNSSPTIKKVDWIISQLNLEVNNLVLLELTKWIEDYENGWNIIQEIILDFKKNKIKNIEWSILHSIFNEKISSSKITEEDLDNFIYD